MSKNKLLFFLIKRTRIFTYYFAYAILIIILLVLLVEFIFPVIASFGIEERRISQFFVSVVFLFILIINLIAFWTSNRLKNFSKILMDELSHKYNFMQANMGAFQYLPKDAEVNEDLIIGHSVVSKPKIINQLEGIYKNYGIKMYDYYVGNKLFKTSHYIVFKTKINKILPRVVITPCESSIDYFFQNDNNFSPVKELITESNEFNKEFKIFFEKDNSSKENQLRLLNILTPDIMADLIDEAKNQKNKSFHIELNDDDISFYKKISEVFLFFLNKKGVEKLFKNLEKMLKITVNFAKAIEEKDV